MDEKPISPEDARAAADAYRCIIGVFRGEDIDLRGDLGYIRRLILGLACTAAAEMVTRYRFQGLDKDRAEQEARLTAERLADAYDLALLNGGRVPPPPEPGPLWDDDPEAPAPG